MRRGVFGGTFDPPHIGHVHVAEAVIGRLGLDELRILPSADPPHGKAPVQAFADRVAMCEKAFEGRAGVVIDGREGRREGPSYTLDSLCELDGPAIDLVLVVGSDWLGTLETWYRIDAILERAHLAIVTRAGFTAMVPEVLKGARYSVLDLNIPPYSSSEVRALVEAGERAEARRLVPTGVRPYVECYDPAAVAVDD